MKGEAEEPLLDDLFSRLPDEIRRHIFAFRFHIIQSGSDLKCAVDKYLEGDASFQRIHEWDVSNVEDFSEVFSVERNRRCRSFTADISAWNVSKATTMKRMFYRCEEFNADISRWDVGNVRNFQAMFFKCWRFNQDLSKWNVGKATDLSDMFWQCRSFIADVSQWNVGNASDLHNMFGWCYSFQSDVSNWNVSNVVDLSYMFDGCIVFKSDVSQWNVGNAENVSYMFYGCTAFCASAFFSGVLNWNLNNGVVRSNMFGEEDNE